MNRNQSNTSTAKTGRFSSHKSNTSGKPKGKYKAKVTSIRSAAPTSTTVRTRSYDCTECKAPVTKNPVGLLLAARTKTAPEKRAGLGHWRCRCGNKKVSVRVLKPAETPQLKVAA